MGRTLTDDDDRTEGNHPVAVVSYAWWKRDLARDPNVLNRTLKMGTTTFSIVGVAPPEFLEQLSDTLPTSGYLCR